MFGGRPTLVAVAAVLALGLCPGAAVAAGIPALDATVTIAGETTGSVAVSSPAIPAEPEEGCAALPARSFEAKASLSIRSTFKHLVIPLVRLNREGAPERPSASATRPQPSSGGGSRGGSFSFAGDFVVPGEWPSYCSSLRHYAVTAKLAPAAHSRAKPTFLVDPPDFFQLGLGALQGGTTASPTRFEAPYPAESQTVLESLPLFVPSGKLFFPSHTPKAVEVGYDEVGVDWNALQGKLAELRHRSEITIHAHGSYEKQLPVPETIRVGESCADANFEGRGEAKRSTCRESTSASYAITVRRDRLISVR